MASFLRRNRQQLDTKAKIDLAFQVSRGLVVLHQDLICHGDLKIQNILIFNGNDGRYVAKLADFGLSVHSYWEDISGDPERDVYYPLGTPLLCAPEVRNQALGCGSVDIAVAIKADIFSFGLLLWEILNNGNSFFDVAWLDPFRTSTQELGVEEKMAFLSTLPCNELLTYGENFLSAQNMNKTFYEQALQAFSASLQDDPLQRQPIREIWKILLPEAEKTSFDFGEIERWEGILEKMRHGFETWSTQFPRAEFLDYTCLNLPDSLQRRALNELKVLASSSEPFEFFDTVREMAAFNLAQCYLIAFGTGYDSEEALRWLQVSKSHGNKSTICLCRLSEVLGSSSPELVAEPKKQPRTSKNNEIEGFAASELYLMRKIQSRVVCAASQIQALSSEGHSWLHANYIELQATTILLTKIGVDIVGHDDMTTLEIAALLGEDEIMARLLSSGEAITGRKARINALHCACIGGNLSSLKILLEYGAEVSLRGKQDITALHLMIYMPVDLVQRAVSLLIAYRAPTNACSKATRLAKTTFELVGTPIEWAVIARNRDLVAALLPHSKGQERNVLRHAISYAYYEIAEDLLSNGALSGLVVEADCPILNYSQAFTHLLIHGRDGDIAIERTIRLCDAHNLIDYNTMLRNCIVFTRTRSCLKALEVLLDLCPPSTIRQGFESDVRDEVLSSNLYTALGQARANTAWKPVLEAMLRNFSVAELDEFKELKESESGDIYGQENVLFTAVSAGWTTGVQVLLEKGVDRCRKINERTTLSIFDVAALTGDIEMQAILSRYAEENEKSPKNSIVRDYALWWFFRHEDMAREKLNAFIHGNPGNKDSRTEFVVSKAHEVLKQVLVCRDIYFSEHRVDADFQTFQNSLWDTFRALISNESMAGHIDTPDEKDVTMLQRAASFLDLDVIRLLLEAGADANVPFLAKNRAGDDGNDLLVPFLPFQIAIWVSRTASWLFARGTIRGAKKQDAIPSKQAVLEPAIKPQILRRVAHVISHAAETGAKRIKGLTSGPSLTPGEKTAESMRNSSLRVAQEFLQWHLLRNDPRFEGITDFHISSQMAYVSHTIMLVRRDPKIADVKASWPGLEGKYTGLEVARMPWKDERSVFPVNFRRLRGLEKVGTNPLM
ncbi:hypothetical protein BDR22DRAFT_383111 [Usnea florida]